MASNHPGDPVPPAEIDLFEREKFGPLPNAISGQGTRTQAYQVGDMICWAPGPDVTIFYRHDGQKISGRIHVLGKLDFGVQEFGVPGPLEVTIEVPSRDPKYPYMPGDCGSRVNEESHSSALVDSLASSRNNDSSHRAV